MRLLLFGLALNIWYIFFVVENAQGDCVSTDGVCSGHGQRECCGIDNAENKSVGTCQPRTRLRNGTTVSDGFWCRCTPSGGRCRQRALPCCSSSERCLRDPDTQTYKCIDKVYQCLEGNNQELNDDAPQCKPASTDILTSCCPINTRKRPGYCRASNATFGWGHCKCQANGQICCGAYPCCNEGRNGISCRAEFAYSDRVKACITAEQVVPCSDIGNVCNSNEECCTSQCHDERLESNVKRCRDARNGGTSN